MGPELAGVVEAVGSAVTEFDIGDQVFGVNAGRFGAHADFVCRKIARALSAEAGRRDVC